MYKSFFLFICVNLLSIQLAVHAQVPNLVQAKDPNLVQPNNSEYVGAKKCINCHQQAYKNWQGSHHDMSMKHADEQSVLGDFNQISFLDIASNKPLNKFYKKGKQYWVTIKGGDGEFHDYQIKYTFGLEPLQQYMVEFEDGRVQLIPFAWDSRPNNEGGQRWFNLYPDITSNHQEFFWTNTGQNWNYMCADCHSTNVDKNFDLKTNSYNTTFSEINVACESCHGPASGHIAWSKDQKPKTAEISTGSASNTYTNSMKNNLSSNVSNTVSNTVKNDLSNSKYLGFDRDLSKSVDAWFMDTTVNSKTLSPKNIDHSQQVLVCAQCHSRRTQVSEKDHVKGNAFGETYLLDLISNTNYHPDGQVYNENFVYGSFLQSKMYQKGVVCSDCHDPHSAKLKLPVETLCLQCHQSESYATPKHHQHEAESSGAQCVNCHMPETTYMEIDARRDHGFHIPRPDLAKQLGTPDTCLSCHEDKNSDWSLQNVNQWFPQSTVADEKDFPPVFAATNMLLNEKQLQGLANELSRIAQTIGYAPIIRASALSKMSNMSNTNTIIAIARAVKNSDENIRLGAIEGTQNMASAEKWRILSPLLNDKVFAVRTNAAFALTNLWQEVTPAQQQQLTPALNEYLASQAYNSDRSFAHSNTGIVYIYQQQYTKAIEAFKKGIKIEPYFAQTYLNLSQVYRQLGQDDLALKTFKAGIAANPKNAELPYNLALAYIRMKDTVQAAEYLSQATQRAPDNSHYFYVYGLALEQVQPKKSYKALYQAFQISQDPQHLYALCDMQIRHENIHAKRCLTKLTPLVPANISQALNQRLKGISHE